MAEVEKLSEGLSFLTKPEIVNIVAKKYMAPPEPKKMAQLPKHDPQNPWGKGMSLVKGPGTKTMILCPSKGVEVDLELVQESLVYLTPEQAMLKEEAVDVKTVTKARSGVVVVTAKDNLSLKQKAALHSVIGAALDNAEMREVEKKTHSCLKFDFLPTRHQDGAEITVEEITRELRAHPQWRDIQMVEIPKMIKSKTPNMCTLLCKVEDDAKGSKAKQLLRTAVSFGMEMRRCKEWVNCPQSRQCSICQCWGHSSFICRVHSPICTVCGDFHPTSTHKFSCSSCEGICVCNDVHCVNCAGPHRANSVECAFFKARNNPKQLKKLEDDKRDQIQAKHEEKSAKCAGKKHVRVDEEGFTMAS